MICNVIVTKKTHGYIAKAVEWPDIVVENDNRERLIEDIRRKLIDYLANAVDIVQVEIPDREMSGNPWRDKFGFFKDDPTFNDLQDEIRKIRIESDHTGV